MTARETYIRHRRPLFWSVSEDKLPGISKMLVNEHVGKVVKQKGLTTAQNNQASREHRRTPST